MFLAAILPQRHLERKEGHTEEEVVQDKFSQNSVALALKSLAVGAAAHWNKGGNKGFGP